MACERVPRSGVPRQRIRPELLATVRENADRYLPGSELHLFTTHAGLYEKFGWVFEAEIDTFLEPRIQRLYRLPASGEPN